MSQTVRPLRRNEIRQQNETLILQAAEKVFAEAGFGGATVQLIADMAGLPKASGDDQWQCLTIGGKPRLDARIRGH